MKKKRKKRCSAMSTITTHPPSLRLVSYKISYEPLGRKDYPPEVDRQMEELYDLIYENPKSAIPRLLELKTKYPQVTELYNWLAASQAETGDITACEATVKENYEKNPNYLFAKFNYAELCLRQNKFDEIPIIFDHKFDLN